MSYQTFNRVMAWLTVFVILFLLLSSGLHATESGVQNSNASSKDRIPARAYQYQKILHAEVRRQWGLNMPQDTIAVSAGTIHQESGWQPTARSPYAKGLTQFTDPTWADIVRLDPSIATLGDIWNPHAAIRAMARYHRLLWTMFSASGPDNRPLTEERDRWAFVLAGYNGGPGWIKKDQTLAASKGLNSRLWWDNVELHSARAAWAFKENRTYPRNIIKRWVPLYRTF